MRKAIGIIAPLVLGLCACAAEGGADGRVIRIGLSGPVADPSGRGMLQGAQLAVEEINRRGGIGGRKLELVVRDDGMDPEKAIEVAAEFRDESDVVAVVGPLTSGATIEAAGVYGNPDNGLVAISPGATSPALSGRSPWVFRVCPTDLQQASALADWAHEHLGLERAEIIYVNDAFGRGVLNAFVPAFQELGGTIIGRDPYLPEILESETMLDPYLERAIRRGMDALVIVGMDKEVVDILRAARRLGYRGAIMGTDGLVGIEDAGPFANGVYVTSGFLTDRPTEAARTFVRNYVARFGEEPRDGSAHAYDSVMLLERAIAEVGPDRRAIRDYIASVGSAVPAYEGVTGTIRFDQNGDAVGKDVVVGVVRDGALVTVLAGDAGAHDR